jgi:NAD(P)-dependent dehydrogenase (short-subunit alcohol dehydrogenase family)
MSNVAIITGAGSGFGLELSKKLLAKDWIVYAADIDKVALEKAATFGARPLLFDVTSDKQVTAGVAKVIKETGRVDLMVANAGFGHFSSVEETSPEKVRALFEVNVFGVERCVRAVLPQMRKQGSGRILMTASVVATVSLVGLGWYAATKHAIRAMANALRQEVKALGIKVSVIEPGTVRTNFDQVAFGHLRDSRTIGDYDKVMNGFNKWLGGLYRNSPGPKQVVKTMFRAATASNPKPIYPASWDVRVLKFVFLVFGRRVTDAAVLWLAKR